MKRQHAFEAIKAILAAIDDDSSLHLPSSSRTETPRSPGSAGAAGTLAQQGGTAYWSR